MAREMRNGEFCPVRIDENTLLTEGNEYLEEKIRIFAKDCEEAGVEWSSDLDYIARHFFELGFNAKEK